MREAIRRDDFISMSRSRPSMNSGPAPHAPPSAPSLEHFEYCRISDEWGIVRLLARVHDELGVPSDPLLLLTSAQRPGSRDACSRATLPQLVAPRAVATERQLGSPTLAWRADFAVPTELVERFDAVFALHDGPARCLGLPTPVLRVGAVDPGSLALTRLPRAVGRPTTRRRQRAAALAVSAAALGTAATPAAAAAATGTTAATGSVTATRARVAVTTTTSAAVPAGMATAAAGATAPSASGATGAATTTATSADPVASDATGTTTTHAATTTNTTTTTATQSATTTPTSATPTSTTVAAPAPSSGEPAATDATGTTTTTRGATATKTTTTTATQSASAATTGTAQQRGSTSAGTLTPDPRASAARRCAPRASATLAGTSGHAAGVAASSLVSPAPSASPTGSPPAAHAAGAVCVTESSASPQRQGEHARTHRPGATTPRHSGVAAVWLSPSTPAGHAAAQRRRAERAAARARATAHEATAIQLAAGLAAAARRAERAQQAHEARDRAAAESTAGTSSTTTAGGGHTTPSTPGYSGPTSWTGTVAADPGLTGVVRNLAGLLTDGNRPPSFLIPIYIAAGRRYHVPWQVLAAINAVETDYGRDLNTSGAGAVGWMQFMPGTWREYGVAVDGASVPNPYDPRDAIFAAARYLAANGARSNLRGAIYAYNHADWYVAEVLSRAQAIASQPQYEQASVSRRGSVSVQFTIARPHPARITYRSGFLSHFDRLIAAANMVSAADFPYYWGGGHEQPARFGPFDCSGSVSYVMQQAGYEVATTVSGAIGDWGLPRGPGRVTIFYNAVHTFMRIGNRYFGTSGFARPGGGAGWFDVDRLPAGYLAAFNEVHVPELGADSFAADPQLGLTFRARPGLLRARARLTALSALRAFGHERLSALAIHRALAHPLRKSVSLPPR